MTFPGLTEFITAYAALIVGGGLGSFMLFLAFSGHDEQKKGDLESTDFSANRSMFQNGIAFCTLGILAFFIFLGLSGGLSEFSLAGIYGAGTILLIIGFGMSKIYDNDNYLFHNLPIAERQSTWRQAYTKAIITLPIVLFLLFSCIMMS